MATNAQHQASYRARQVSEGSTRLDTHISAEAHTALDHVAQREGCTRKDAIELAILNEAKGRDMQSQFRTDDPATDPGGRRSTGKPAMATIRLTAEEVTPRKPVSQPATLRKDESPMTTTNPAPARPSQLTVAEHQELERFKAQAAIGIHMHEQDVKAHAFNGGDAGARRKAAFEAQLNASNIHRK
jgi:hypothetical protein